MGSPAGKGAKSTKRHKELRSSREKFSRAAARKVASPYRRFTSGRKSIVKGRNTALANIRQAGKAGPDILVP